MPTTWSRQQSRQLTTLSLPHGGRATARLPRETQRERHRETQRDTERHRETQRDRERERETERERDFVRLSLSL